MQAIAGNSNHCTKASLGDIPKDNGEKKNLFNWNNFGNTHNFPFCVNSEIP